MKTINSHIDLTFMAGIVFIFPATYFFVSAFLNDLHFPFFWNLIGPYFERPENKSLGLNANLLIAFGPVIAILLNLPHVLRLEIQKKGNDQLEMAAYIQLNSIRWLIIGAGFVCMEVLTAYLFVENCNGH